MKYKKDDCAGLPVVKLWIQSKFVTRLFMNLKGRSFAALKKSLQQVGRFQKTVNMYIYRNAKDRRSISRFS